MNVRDSDAIELVVQGVVESETEAESLDLIEVKSPSISVSVSQIYADRDCQDSDLTSFILLPSVDTEDGALMILEDTSDHVIGVVTNMKEGVSGTSHQYTEAFSPLQTFVECPVCGVRTPNHRHYGALACHSCKAFFRRSVVSPSIKLQKCRTGKENCLIHGTRRNNCPYCRFKKCMTNGMDPDMIKRPNETKRVQILQCHKLILSQTSGVNLMTVPDQVVERLKENIANYAANVANKKDVLAIATIEHIFVSVKMMFLRYPELRLLNLDQPELSTSNIFLRVQEIMLEITVRFMKGCPFFQSLPWNCKAKLLR